MADDGKVEGAAKVAPKRVAIVATGPSSLRFIERASNQGGTQYFDEVWTVNSYAGVIRSDRLFHMDDFLVQEKRAEKNPRIAAMLEAIKKYAGPVITCRPLERYPTSVEFPLGQVIQHFGACYFNGTVAYMAAYAGWFGVEEVHFFGCDYSWPDKQAAERGRSCLEYWLGQLNARGVVTRVCENSTLMDAHEQKGFVYPIYGYSDGHVVTLTPLNENSIKLSIVPKPEEELPSAEDMEKRYDHGEVGPAVIDVMDRPPVQ